MAKKIKSKKVYKFKKGDEYSLDAVYMIQGVLSDEWFKDKDDDPFAEVIIITRDVHFEITEYI